jgi:CDP-2,3-bis-(O-geranylgeranyl)-sn-glycerol synthase
MNPELHDLLLAGQMLVLVALANTAPLVAKKLLGRRFSLAMDFGLFFPDGMPWLGPSKTWRGLAAALLACGLLAPLIGLAWTTGLLLAFGAVLGDALSSFTKRRLRIPSSGKAPGLDQIPEVLVPLLLARIVQPLPLPLVAADVLLFLLLEPPLARLWHRWGLREQPY